MLCWFSLKKRFHPKPLLIDMHLAGEPSIELHKIQFHDNCLSLSFNSVFFANVEFYGKLIPQTLECW